MSSNDHIAFHSALRRRCAETIRAAFMLACVFVVAACGGTPAPTDAGSDAMSDAFAIDATSDASAIDAFAIDATRDVAAIDATSDVSAIDATSDASAIDATRDVAAIDAPQDAAAAVDGALDTFAADVVSEPVDALGLPPPRVLVFSYTTGYRHASIPDGVAAFQQIAIDRGWQIDATESPARFTDASLAAFDVVVFLCTTGELLDTNQQDALQRWFRAGGGWVGVHAAADAEYNWPWYGELVGAWFLRHPAIQPATLTVDRSNPITAHLPAMWMRTDEWYDFQRNPRSVATVLMTIDESTYTGGTMGADHPMTWLREYEGGRTFYTELGHTPESYADPAFLTMLGEAVQWAAHRL